MGAGMTFALVYCVLLPITSPRLTEVLGSPVAIATFCLLVGAAAVNVLTDSVFLSLDRVWDYLRLNGIALGVAKCVLPFLLVGAGAMGLYGSVGGATALCALASLWVVFRRLPGRRALRPSRELREARRFAGAGYATYVLTVLPLLVFPLLVINALGAAAGAAYFISFQIVTLLHAVVLAVANATYAEAERARHGRRHVTRRGGATLVGGALVGAVVLSVLAPYFLLIFGEHYVSEGTWTLRVLAFATVGAAFNYWGAIRLRLSGNHAAMIGVQAVSTAVMLVLAGALASHGTVWVGAAWGVGHLVGGVAGFVATATVAKFADSAPVGEEPTAVRAS
jgi:O-antigen/teichoic acid export membrane protein